MFRNVLEGRGGEELERRAPLILTCKVDQVPPSPTLQYPWPAVPTALLCLPDPYLPLSQIPQRKMNPLAASL